MTPLLEIENLSVKYGAIEAVRNVSLQVMAGGLTALIGSNGAGKTSTLRAISGLVTPAHGQVRFEGRPLGDLPTHQRVALGIAHAPEGRGIFPNLTVLENLELGSYLRRDRQGVRNHLDAEFVRFPVLAQRRSQLAGTLSGGEQQMLAVSRALMSRPKLLLLDEPSLGLAPQVSEKIFETLEAVYRSGVAVLLVEQNAQKALSIAQRGYVLETGAVAMTGTGPELLRSPDVRKAYLGE